MNSSERSADTPPWDAAGPRRVTLTGQEKLDQRCLVTLVGTRYITQASFELAAPRLTRLEKPSAFDFVHDAAGKLLEHRDVFEAPRARLAVDDTEAANRVAVSRYEWDSGVGDDAHFPDRGIEPHERIAARVLDDEGSARRDNVLAEGVRDRRFA